MANVTVIGIGAMGGGMAHALLASPATSRVVGFDQSEALVQTFYNDTKQADKAADSPPNSLKEAITSDTDFVVLVLVNEQQCQQVCFGSDDNLITLVPDGACIILCSTVTATWARAARDEFQARGIHFVDCPVSGGPIRAKLGDLTMMASGSDESLALAKPLLDAMGRDVFIIQGGAGMGSTVKMVHQLLAGVHIVSAAEALALAAKAGLDVEQMYEIVNGAAGASWMFSDRGKRMISDGDEVMSALNIFIKDLDIVYSEAKALQSPIPVASAALQQFIIGQGMGLGRKDDSQVIKVYESVTGVPVAKSKSAKSKVEGDNVGDVWKMQDGSQEEILEVGAEPRHVTVIHNEYVRALRVSFPPGDTTFAHRHAEDSIYFFLVKGGLDIVNHVKGSDPKCDCVEFGEVRYGTHKSDKPLIHKITNKSDKQLLCIDAEVLKRPPVVAAIPLVAEKHELIKTRDKCRVYKLTLEPGESVEVSYPFFYFLVVLQPSTIKTEIGGAARGISWEETKSVGDVQWKEPVTELKVTNVGESTYEAFISEWR
jgi:3-hydroxyisobutyrate dehydrogenase-like beta-hydroxyacid dehydrogenase